jgi:hypothetical protein
MAYGFITLTKKELKQMLADARNEALSYAEDAMHVIYCTVIADELGVGEDIILRIMNRVTDRFDAVKSGHVTFDELRQQASEEIGLTFNRC